MTRSAAWAALLGGLALSGVAGIVNQVVWQRALKIFLGGSETLSSMIVVLVFMLGLGLGAGLAGRVAPRLRHPLRALAAVELALALGNAGVAVVLGLDLTETVYAAQRLAVSAGIPLRALYAVGSAALLLPPTMLMGSTMPLASEASQRQLGATSGALVPLLFFVNTVGAAVGAWSASAWLLPAVGQRAALLCAVGCNAVAAALIGVGARAPGAAPSTPTPRASGRLTREEVLGGVLGFLALGYEMVLFRVLALAHKPVPTTFATGLAGFLLAWSVGMSLAGRITRGAAAVAVLGALAVGLVPMVYDLDLRLDPMPLPLAITLYTLPCVAFGLLYGQLVTRAAKDWGRDVGRYAAVNTLGSCLGVLFFTLVGYELPQALDAWAIALGLGAVAAVEVEVGEWRWPARGLGVLAALGAVAALAVGWSMPYTEADGLRTYWGRDGVVEVAPDDDVFIDGLWHTRLTDGESHVGNPYNWVMAFGSIVATLDRDPKEALVVGAGVGISSATLHGLQGLNVEGYEINHTLQRVLRDYRGRTMDAAYTPGIRWIWQDARTGLALEPRQYDILLSAPLYLRQAGSSLLLSVEYLRLARSRLRPGGVIAVYSNEGSDAQTRLIQATIAEVFPYRITWYDGLVTIASDRPVDVTREQLDAALRRPDRIFQEARRIDEELRADGGLYSWYDGDEYTRDVVDQVISDDRPLVEYPELADRWVGGR